MISLECWPDGHHYDLKHEAEGDFFKNYESNIAKYKKTKTPSTLKFSFRKMNLQCLTVQKEYWNRGSCNFYYNIFPSSNMRAA